MAKKKKQDWTPEEAQQYEEWKSQHDNKKLSKSDKAILDMAFSGIANAIVGKIENALLILYSTYNRNYHFVDVGCIHRESMELTEKNKQARKVGEFDIEVSKNQCRFTFRLMGCEIKLIYKKDPNFMEV